MKKEYIYYIVFAVFSLLIVLPLVDTFIGIFFSAEIFENLKLIKESLFVLLSKSIFIAFLSALIATFLGIILALLLYKTKLWLRNYFKILILIPLFVSPYILAVAWRDFFFLTFKHIDFISSTVGTVFVLVSIYTPLSILIVGSAMRNINAELEESALLLTTLPKVIFKIILPLIKPAIISSFVLIFIFSISEFSVPAFFGVRVFTTEIFTQFSAFYNYSLSVLQSLILLVICILLLFSERNYLVGASFLVISSKGNTNKIYDLGKNNIIAFLFSSIYLFFSVVLPISILTIQSFQTGTTQFTEAFRLLIPTFKNSFELSFTAAILSVFIGFIVAYFSVNEKQNKLNKPFNMFLLIIFAIPSIIFGISLIKFYNRPNLEFIYSSTAIIIIAYLGKFSFISTKLIENSMRQIPKSIDEAAQIEGISFYSRIVKILIPMIMPALFTAFIINFIFNLGELAISIMLYPPGIEIMPIKVYTIMANASQSLTASMTLIVLLLSLSIMGIFYLIFNKFIDKSAKKKMLRAY